MGMEPEKPKKNKNSAAMPIKLRGGATNKIRTLDSDDLTIQALISILRPLNVFTKFSHHPKCHLTNENTHNNLCKFCLVRSLILKLRGQKGRLKIQPIEFQAAFEDLDSETLIEDLNSIINQLNSIIPSFREHFLVKWNCLQCQKNDLVLDLTMQGSNQDISFLVNNFEECIFKEHGHHDGTVLKLSDDCTVLIFHAENKMAVKMSKLLSFGGKKWRCKSCLTANDYYFSTNDGYITTKDTTSIIDNNAMMNNVELAVYEIAGGNLNFNEDVFVYSGRNDNQLIRKCTPEGRKDRHKPSEKPK